MMSVLAYDEEELSTEWTAVMIRLCVELSLGFPLSVNSSIQNSNETEEEKNKNVK